MNGNLALPRTTAAEIRALLERYWVNSLAKTAPPARHYRMLQCNIICSFFTMSTKFPHFIACSLY